MQKQHRYTLITTALLLAVGAYAYENHRHQQATAIRSVATQFAEAEKSALISGNGQAKTFSATACIEAIRKIDVSKTPVDFQKSWGDYIASYQREQDSGQKNSTETKIAWAEVEQDAADYNVQIHR